MKYILLMSILVIAMVSLSATTVPAGDVEIALEAELANKIQAPMVIAVPTDAKDEGGLEPDEPSNGEFIWAPGKPVEGGANGDRGWAEFIIEIPEDGEYAIWGHVVAWDGNSDSFWVVWEPADAFENPQQTQNMDFRWSVGNGPAWHWDRIEAWKADDTHVDRVWELDKGPTKLTIFTREDATMLDCLYVTNDLVGGQANARVPTDEDRELQKKGAVEQAVDAAGKLSTAWGGIKSDYSN